MLNKDEAAAEGWVFGIENPTGYFVARNGYQGATLSAPTLKSLLGQITALVKFEGEENEARLADYWKEKKTR